MRYSSALAILLLAFALIGAPFGMGRMMDGAHSQGQSSHSRHIGMDHGDMVGGKAGEHKPNTLHFVMCSANVACQAAEPVAQLLSFEIVRPHMNADAALYGNGLLPLTPPPRT